MTKTLSSRTPGVLVDAVVVRVSSSAPRGRLSLRARGDVTPFAGALGFSLPDRIGRRAEKDGVEALRLGPDEWTIVAPLGAVAGIVAACAAIYPTHPHALVDISARETTLVIEGPQAAELLTIGCARDIDALPVGEGRRTLFDGATVVLWKDKADAFRMDIWNSFASHLLALLETGCAELAADVR